MRIGVEEPFAEDLLVVAREQLAGGLAAGLLGRRLAHADAGDLVHDEQAAGRELEVDARRVETVEVGQQRPDALDAGGLDREIELAPQRFREVREHRGQVDDALEGGPVAGLLREQLEQGEVLEDLAFRARALHLEHDRRAVGQARTVHLRDRPGRERMRVDVRERVLPRHAELALHHRDHLGLRQRRHVVLQPGELRDELGRQQVRARREHLAELGERRAELLERLAHPARAVGRRAVVAQAVTGEDPSDLGSAAEQALARLALRLRGRAVGHEDDAAASRVRHAVGDVGKQELRAVAHARVREHDQVTGALGRLAHDGRRRIGVLRIEREHEELGLEAISCLARPRHRAAARLGHGEDPLHGHAPDSDRSLPAASGLALTTRATSA